MIGFRHPSVQRLRRLSRRRSARTDEGAFVIDGPTLLAEALDAGVEVVEVIAEPGAPADLLERAASAGAAVRQVPDETLARATDTVQPQAVAAIGRIPANPCLPRTGFEGSAGCVGARPVGLALVAVGLNDPGNAGTLLRSADAAGVDLVVFCDDSVDPYNPKCVRAAAGALFRLRIVRAAEGEATLAWLRQAGVRTLGMVARGGTVYDEVDYAVPSAIVLGSEAHGLPGAVESLVDELVTIPMCGPTESLNVGMAGTIVCFEALRQRRAAGTDRTERGNRLDDPSSSGAGCSAYERESRRETPADR